MLSHCRIDNRYAKESEFKSTVIPKTTSIKSILPKSDSKIITLTYAGKSYRSHLSTSTDTIANIMMNTVMWPFMVQNYSSKYPGKRE